MREPVDYFFPPVTSGAVPFWRLVLRGCSQLCFQSNELTGVFFFAAALVASPIAFVYLVIAGIMAPAGRMMMGEREQVLATGLPGLNPCLIALALPAFFQTGWTNVGMWIVLVVCVAITIVLVRVCVAGRGVRRANAPLGIGIGRDAQAHGDQDAEHAEFFHVSPLGSSDSRIAWILAEPRPGKAAIFHA